MSIKKMPIGLFVEGLREAYDRKDGYIMGTKGQDPKTLAENGYFFNQYSGAQKTKALYWREHAKRVWDCNGMAEGLYEDYTGVNINTRARYNYSGWCGTKGTGKIPAKYRVPGAALFIHSSSAGYITHVGYLDAPVDANNTSGDWWVIEARGVMYGVVRTKMSERPWNRWGLMTKYFDYSTTTIDNPKVTSPYTRTLRNGCKGNDVKQMQEGLIKLGYNCGRWGADGDFGDSTEEAVRTFQKVKNLTVDGIFGPNTANTLEGEFAKFYTTPENPSRVKIIGGNCYIRTEPNTSGKIVGTAKRDEVFDYGGSTALTGWPSIKYEGNICWVSDKYSKLI